MNSLWRRVMVVVIVVVVIGGVAATQLVGGKPRQTTPLPPAQSSAGPSLQPPAGQAQEPAEQAAPTPTASISSSGSSPEDVRQRVAALEKQAQQEPFNGEARLELARLYFQLRVYPRAADYFADALDIDPNNAKARNDLGSSLMYQGMLGLARREYLKAIAIDSSLPDSHYNLAIILSHSSQPDIPGALAEWREVVRLAPGTELASSAEKYIQSYEKQVPEAAQDVAPKEPAAQG